MNENKSKKNKSKKIIIISILIVIVLTVIGLIIYATNNSGVINTEGISLEYRLYTSKGWTKWYKNGQIAGYENTKVLAVEAKVESNKTGHILYNIYSSNDDFNDNDTYDGETAGDKENAIYGVKFYLTDDLFKDYQIYYRTHNKKDGWLGWSYRYGISGDNEVDIDQIQIKILPINETFKESFDNSSIGF